MKNFEYKPGDIVASYRYEEIVIFAITKSGNYEGRIISQGLERGCYVNLRPEDIKGIVM